MKHLSKGTEPRLPIRSPTLQRTITAQATSNSVKGADAAAAAKTSTLTRGLVRFEVGKLALDLVDVVVREVVVALRLQRVRHGRHDALLRRLRARRGVRPARR